MYIKKTRRENCNVSNNIDKGDRVSTAHTQNQTNQFLVRTETCTHVHWKITTAFPYHRDRVLLLRKHSARGYERTRTNARCNR